MKIKLAPQLLLVGLLAMFLTGLSFNAEAGPKRNKPPEDLQPNDPSLQAVAKQLDDAYTLIHDGLWDYQGHRAKAQKQVQLAAKVLGLTLRGDKRDKIPRKESDIKMNQAKAILLSVRPVLQAKSITKAVNHVSNAIQQIEEGLAAANK